MRRTWAFSNARVAPRAARLRGAGGGQRAALRGQVGRPDDRALGIEGVDGDRALVQIDSGEQHERSRRILPTRMRSLGSLGISGVAAGTREEWRRGRRSYLWRCSRRPRRHWLDRQLNAIR